MEKREGTDDDIFGEKTERLIDVAEDCPGVLHDESGVGWLTGYMLRSVGWKLV